MSVTGRDVQVVGDRCQFDSEPIPSAGPFRLRFLLQEFELPDGNTLIGRGLECHIALHDPLVSRRHARIWVESMRAVFEDLGSRNGSRVNGILVTEPRQLFDRDRIRIGTQELVFARVDPGNAAGSHRVTGSLVYCAACIQPYPRESGECPHCGSKQVASCDPNTAPVSPGVLHVWAFDMVLQLLQRALTADRVPDIERHMRQALDAFPDRLADSKPIEPSQFQTLFDATDRLIEAGRYDTWVVTMVELCKQAGLRVPERLARCSTQLRCTEMTAVDTTRRNV